LNLRKPVALRLSAITGCWVSRSRRRNSLEAE
jgi:hypothetical protein